MAAGGHRLDQVDELIITIGLHSFSLSNMIGLQDLYSFTHEIIFTYF